MCPSSLLDKPQGQAAAPASPAPSLLSRAPVTGESRDFLEVAGAEGSWRSEEEAAPVPSSLFPSSAATFQLAHGPFSSPTERGEDPSSAPLPAPPKLRNALSASSFSSSQTRPCLSTLPSRSISRFPRDPSRAPRGISLCLHPLLQQPRSCSQARDYKTDQCWLE